MKKKSNQLLWYTKEKKVISCDETNKVLNENYIEISNIIQNSFDDAILMGCDENDFKKKITVLVNNLDFSLGKK
tara:strand:+ start:883 stop:1104 length:222 start_codon:yes stop_codon:yes gene_type:complete